VISLIDWDGEGDGHDFNEEIPLQIKSVIAIESLKGYIYVKAYKQQHVKQVC
jgi:hypothetical protein